MSTPDTTPTAPAEQNPQAGGSYVRQPDGSLTPAEPAQPHPEQE